MKPSESLDEFLKLYWDDLTPEHINHLMHTKDEVAKLEAELEALTLRNADITIDRKKLRKQLQQAQVAVLRKIREVNSFAEKWSIANADIAALKIALEQSRQREVRYAEALKAIMQTSLLPPMVLNDNEGFYRRGVELCIGTAAQALKEE